MDTADNVENAAAEQRALDTIPSTEDDALEATMADTPVDIKSSPPPPANLTSTALESRDASPAGAKCDSDAETVLLDGINGHSPAKTRRVIKLEDKSNDIGTLEDMVEKSPEVQENAEVEGTQDRGDGAPSSLGKRKRAKHGNRLEHPHNGNSSGLSSVPTSPVATTRSALSKPAESESELSKSPSPRVREAHQEKKSRSVDQNPNNQKDQSSVSADDKDQRRVRREKNTRAEAPGSHGKSNRDPQSKTQHDNHNTRRTRSTSPLSQETRRSTSRQPSGTSTNGLSQKKKKVPAPLRATRDRRSSDDESSAGESPHPRRSRTRNLATPPTGESSASMAKLPKKRRFQYGLSALAVACEHGDVRKARQELQEAPEDIDFPDNAGNTPLQCASINGHADVVRLLIKSGCNVHCVNSKKDSPLLDAAENGHLEVVKVLLAAGVNPRARNLQGEEPLNKVDDDYEDADAIREALLAARVVAPPRQQSPALQTPSLHTKNSGSISTNPRTLSHGRSTKTGENQLFIGLNVESLRSAAGAGDQGTVFRIMDAISVNGLDDPESLVAAARGGHYDVLQLLLALGSMNRDPAPLPHKDPEHATPILAAIGGDNLEVIQLLIGSPEDGGFDPTRKYDGRTYYEIAKERSGPYWQDECRILKEAFDKYKPSSSSRRNAGGSPSTSRSAQKRSVEERSTTSKNRHQKDGATNRPIKRETSTADGTPIKRGPGRPRKEDREHYATSDHESAPKKQKVAPRKSDSDAATLASESEPSKPRRKLISGKDLKGERERRASVASVKSVKSVVSPSDTMASTDATKDNRGTSDGASRTVSRASEPVTGNEKSLDRARSLKRDDSKDRLSVIRGESPAKRPRSSLSPSESHASGAAGSEAGASHKRRRLESDSKTSQRVRARRSSSPDPRPNRSVSASHSDKTLHKGVAREAMRDTKKDTGRAAENRDSKIPSASKTDTSPSGNFTKSNHTSKRTASPSDLRSSLEETKSSKQRIDSEARIKREAEVEEKIQKESERQAQLEREMREAQEAEEARKAREEKEANEAEEARKLMEAKQAKEAEEARKVQEEMEAKAAKEAEEAAAQKLREEELRREKEEEAKRKAEETARREAEEAEQREKERREEAQAHVRAEEERRRLYLEQQRVQREEQEARRAQRMIEQAAERQRLFKEQEAARLAKLPPLLRWLDGCDKPATTELAHTFRNLQGVRYDTIVHSASGTPDGKEQWLLNTQVALLLGEKDLQLSRYTAWERIPVSDLAKRTLWKVLSEDYSLLSERLRVLTKYGGPEIKVVGSNRASEIRTESWPTFLGLDMFFVKVSDFMYIVPKIPHLKNVEILVGYRELPPDESYLNKMSFPAKWKTDEDAESRFGFCPGKKYYVNGILKGEDKPKTAEARSTPFPTKRVPRIDGLREVFPGDPSYEKLCVEQGLEHLLSGRRELAVAHGMLQNGVTPPDSIASLNEETRRASDTSTASYGVPNGLTNGTNGTL